MNESLVLVDTIDHESAATADVVDGILRDLLDTRSLDDDVKTVWVRLLELLPLRARVLSVELDVIVRSVKLLCDVHLDALVRGDDDTVRTVLLEQLGEDETGWAGSKEEDFNANWRVQLVETVDGACRGLEKC